MGNRLNAVIRRGGRCDGLVVGDARTQCGYRAATSQTQIHIQKAASHAKYLSRPENPRDNGIDRSRQNHRKNAMQGGWLRASSRE